MVSIQGQVFPYSARRTKDLKSLAVLCGWAGIAYQCTVYIDVYKPYLPRCVHDVII